MEGIRFRSPYRRWIMGLLTELGAFIAFMCLVGLVAYVVYLVN